MDSIIFDVDGTLWNSTKVVAEAWRSYLKEQENIEMDITPEKLTTLFGLLLSDIARALFPEKSEAEQLRIIDRCCQAEHDALLRYPVPLYPGMQETLEELSKQYPLFIVSNCQAGYIEVFLENTKTASLFRGHLCPGDTGKAKAENIGILSHRYGLNSPVYIGDTQGDFKACQDAGIAFIHAAYGFGRVPQAPYKIEKPADLPVLIQSLSQ
ncbi:MAG: HAD family hydrolase [Blautia sp.]|nr:HAD family hydrolase [Blautia sp.]